MVEEKEAKDVKPREPAAPTAPRKRLRALLIVAVIGVIAIVGGVLFWRYAQTYESTDDAQINSHLNNISTRVSGTVAHVYVEENQFVKAGQVIADLDPRDYELAVEQARAQLTESQAEVQVENPGVPITQTSNQTTISSVQADILNAQAGVAAAERDHAAAIAKLRESEARAAKAQADIARYKMLVDKDEVSKEQFDQVIAESKVQAATVDSSRESAAAAQKTIEQRRAQLSQVQTRLNEANQNAPQQLAIRRATVRSKQAGADSAKAQVDRALLDLSYVKIIAPVNGIVSKRTVEVGQRIQPGQQLFTMAQIDDLWVTANFKETQLKHIVPGQRVSVQIDAFDQTFDGYVESLPASTDAISSLLPPENATGNYVKVVQRMPVRIRFKKDQQGVERLRPGMSVVPKIWLQ